MNLQEIKELIIKLEISEWANHFDKQAHKTKKCKDCFYKEMKGRK